MASECTVELQAFLGEDEGLPVNPSRRGPPWRRTGAAATGVACLLVALALFSKGNASAGGLETPSAKEVLVLVAASNSSGGNKSGGNGSGSNKSGGNSSGGNGSGGNKSGSNGSVDSKSGGNGSGSNKSGGNGSGGGSNSSGGNITACSPPHGGCLVSKCCTDPTYRCYKKNDQWAQCRSKCQSGIDPYDQGSDKSWSCDDWDTTPGKCAGAWEGCLNTKCCREKNQRCFKKNDLWAQCRESCAPGLDPHDQAGGKNVTAWSCIKFDKTPELPKEKCSIDVSANCFSTRCCKNATSTCFKKDGGWAACSSNCSKDFNPLDPPEHRRKWLCDLM